MSTPTLERGIDQNENEKNVIERRGRVTFRPGIAKVARSVSRNDMEGGRDRRTPSKRRNTSSVHLFSFHETRTDSRYDRYYPRSLPVKHAPEMKSFTCYILSTVLDNRARSRTKRTIEREHANRPFRFLLRKSNGFA